MARDKVADKSKARRKADQATKTVAAILQEFGRQAFDTSDRSEQALQEMCDRWIAHLLHGDVSPNRSDLDANWLDWPGVRDFVASERGREKSYVVKNIDEYQQLALTLLSDFSEALHTEQDADGELRDRLDNLRDDAATKTGDELKNEVFSAIGQLNEMLEAKKNRQDAQLQTLALQVTTLESELAQARESAERDGLTMLYNRASFDRASAGLIEKFAGKEPQAALLMADIDHFKKLNDTHGHPFGDEVIRTVAATIGSVFGREEDFVARYGGEEFAIIAEGKIAEVRSLADHLLKSIRALRFEKDGQPVSVTISVGLASLKKSESADGWIERADKALYASKEGGRNRMTISTS